jgi:hypothetical protein
MIIADNRTPEERKKFCWLVVATDTFLSGWGDAGSKYSYAAWACDTLEAAERVSDRVARRGDTARVRIVDGKNYRPNSRYCGHLSIYVVDNDHRYNAPE